MRKGAAHPVHEVGGEELGGIRKKEEEENDEPEGIHFRCTSIRIVFFFNARFSFLLLLVMCFSTNGERRSWPKYSCNSI